MADDKNSGSPETLFRFQSAMEQPGGKPEELLWEVLGLFQDETFYTAKGLDFTYSIRGNEMFVSRKEKSITKATVLIAFEKAMELGRMKRNIQEILKKCQCNRLAAFKKSEMCILRNTRGWS